jgi:hypothetical protein
MKSSNKGSAGGKATAIKLRKIAIDNYHLDPNFCKSCNSIINILDSERVSTVRKKVFCSSSCSATYNNRLRIRKEKPKSIKKEKEDKIGLLTKDELFGIRGSYQSARSTICKIARRVYKASGNPMKCLVCGYEKHTDISHVDPVSEFSGDSKINEINHVTNLVALCPNHHWEFDNKLIDIRNYIKI